MKGRKGGEEVYGSGEKGQPAERNKGGGRGGGGFSDFERGGASPFKWAY
jgi:hypothetical protein